MNAPDCSSTTRLHRQPRLLFRRNTMNLAGFDSEAVEMDLSSRESIRAMLAKAKQYGNITMLVNAAGVSPSRLFSFRAPCAGR